jgi:hypothetical protein
MVFRSYILKTFLLCFITGVSYGQSLSVDELIRYPHYHADQLSDSLEKKGWKKHNLEFVTDSNYVRRTWAIQNTYNDLKSYFLLYDFVNDTAENYTVFQFSNRKDFTEYKNSFKKAGFKELTQKSKGKKKRKKNQKNIYEEKEEIFYSEKLRSVVQIKEIFVYGMFSFLVNSYKTSSGIGKNILQETGNKIPSIQD